MVLCSLISSLITPLKSGIGNGQMYSFSNHYTMTNIYFKFYIVLPKRFEATQASVCGPFPCPGHCYPSQPRL